MGAAATARVDARRKKLTAQRRRPHSVPADARVGHACASARGEQGRDGRAAGGNAAARRTVSPRGPAKKIGSMQICAFARAAGSRGGDPGRVEGDIPIVP